MKRVYVPDRDKAGNPIWKNLDHLWRILGTISTRVLKADVLDLPPKLYSRHEFELTQEQREVYDRMSADACVMLSENRLATAQLAITLLLRLQQIACGYLPCMEQAQPDEDGDFDAEPMMVLHRFDVNPRIEALREVTEDRPRKTIIWARFVEDINQIMTLAKDMGRKAVRYDGSIPEEQRSRNEKEFQEGDADWFVSNQQVGGEGLTLTAASFMVYYSNSFKLKERLQSEDRPHRIGQLNPVEIIDLVATDTTDDRHISALLSKYNMASQCTGDVVRSWLRGKS
jgi:SNF2 family DNA or RNA helicase